MLSSLRQVLQTDSEIHIFCSAIPYIVSKKQPVGSVHEVLAESLETAFVEANFVVNFLQSLALPRHTSPPSEPIVPHPPRQNNLQNLLPLDTSETALVIVRRGHLSPHFQKVPTSLIPPLSLL